MKNGFISLISRLNINQGEKISEFEDPKLKCIKKKKGKIQYPKIVG